MPLFNTFLWLTFLFTICAALPSSCKHSKIVNSREVRASRNSTALHGEPMRNAEGWQCWERVTFLSLSVHAKMVLQTWDCTIGRSQVGNGQNNVTFCPVIKWKCPHGKFLARTGMCWAYPGFPLISYQNRAIWGMDIWRPCFSSFWLFTYAINTPES